MKKSKALSLVLAVSCAIVILAGAIAAPILIRPFYHAHIAPLELEGYGLSREEIVTAYDEMLDFCLGLREDFSVGVLTWSESGRAHFEDVRTLFLLDIGLLAAGLVVMISAVVLSRGRGLAPYRFWGRGPGFWAAVGLVVLLLVVGALAATDFDRAFTVFHRIFFPGKDNWVFDWRADPIILFLPQIFFRNCAILIGGVLALLCGGLIVFDLTAGRKRTK